MTGCQIFFKLHAENKTILIMLDIFLVYSGAVSLVLIFIYGTRNYSITVIAGFIVFCLFYFSFGVKNFEWEPGTLLILLMDAAIIYVISFAISVIIYKLLPLKSPTETASQ